MKKKNLKKHLEKGLKEFEKLKNVSGKDAFNLISDLWFSN